MVSEILNSSSVQRLKGILHSRYGKDLKVSFMMDASTIDMTAQSPSIIEGDLRIPIIAGETWLATAYVEHASDLSKNDQEIVSDLVSLILEPAIKNWQLKSLEFSENQSAPTNVIPFSNLRSLVQRFPEPQIDKVKSLATPVMFLQSKNPHQLIKVADEIHQLTGRWACLRFSDIKSQIQTAKDLAEMGAATLIVEDILMLNPSEQQLLESFLAEFPAEDSPLLLIGSTMTLQEMSNPLIANKALLQQLSKCVVEVDRLPTDLTLLKETLELFLEPGSMI